MIFDLDGTLVDVTEALPLLDGEGGFRAFTEASIACPPRPEIVAAARQAHADGRAVLVVSGREYVWHDLTLGWLAQNGVPCERLYLRIVGDFRSDVEVKADLLAEMALDGFAPVAAWDDKPSVVDLWREHGITAHLVAPPS